MPESKISKTILLWVRKILIYLLSAIIIIAALIFAADKSPQKSLFGFRYYTVLTPSMEPTYSVGDIVVVKLANAVDISEGDVITFNPSSNSEAYLTHRVTQKFEDYENTGVRYLIMSPYMETVIKDNSSGTTVGTITLVRANEYLIPLPPLSEQKRIVAKIEELMQYCDKLK